MQIQLSAPITIDGDQVHTLDLREPKFRDIVKMDAVSGEMAKLQTLIASCANCTEREVGELSMGDVQEITEKLSGFLPSSGAPKKKGNKLTT
jgi:hypothetical protein